MGKWSKRFSKILTAAGIGAIVAVSSLAMPIEVSAARTVTDDVMIRNDASTEAGLIGSLNEGDEVTILDVVQSGDGYNWYYIQLENGATGYVRSDLIEASDEELAAFSVGQEEGEEEAQPEEEQTEETEEEAPAEGQEEQAAAAATQTPAAAAQTADGEYDATKDPNANFTVSYDTADDGTGEWYVHNNDNGSKWKVSDIQDQAAAPAVAAGGVAGIWRTLAILFGILALALAAFVLFLLKSIRDGRSKTTRGRALEAAAAEDDDDDEYYFEDDDEEYGEDDPDDEEDAADGDEEAEDAEESEETAEEKNEDAKAIPDSTITKEISEPADVTEIPAEEIEAAIAATTAQLEKNISAGEAEAENAPEDGKEEYTEVPSSDAAPQTAAAVSSFKETDIDEDHEDEDYEDEDYEDEEDEEEYDDDSDDSDPDEDYEDEDYEDEDYDDEEYDENEDGGSKSSAKGGFFGFLKKMFGSDSKEDAEDEGEDFDDYDDEPEEHEFDEFKEYPEDIDLLPREESDDKDYVEEEEYSEEETVTEEGERGRLSMQRVMKNVSYKEEEADFSGDVDTDDLSDTLFEDDDDMEYSFISSTRRK